MPDIAVYLALSGAVFAGAFVSGLSGFAFSAVAGAILLHVFPPIEAVPLMMACSITVQAANLFALRKSMQWKTSLVFIAGGLLGIPIAIYFRMEIGWSALLAIPGMLLVVLNQIWLAIVIGCLSLLSFPFGTALGIYTLWVLASAGADVEYGRLARAD